MDAIGIYKGKCGYCNKKNMTYRPHQICDDNTTMSERLNQHRIFGINLSTIEFPLTPLGSVGCTLHYLDEGPSQYLPQARLRCGVILFLFVLPLPVYTIKELTFFLKSDFLFDSYKLSVSSAFSCDSCLSIQFRKILFV